MKKLIVLCALATSLFLSGCKQQQGNEAECDGHACTEHQCKGGTCDGQGTCGHEATACADEVHSAPFIFVDDVEWEDAGGGAERQVMAYGKDLMMVKVRFDKGDVGSLHHHPHTQATYVAKGKFEFTINGEKKIVKEGDVLFKLPNVEHGCVCLEDGLLIDTFSPMRDTFLKK